MIMKDAVTDLILKMDRFSTKRGQDITGRQELMRAINTITGEESLDAIYVNNVDNYLIPDVTVIHLYNNEFGQYLMNPDSDVTCPFGYTVEIHQRCFNKYTAEELTAVVLHDILQNVQSDTAKVRFMKAYTAVMSRHDVAKIMDLFDDISLSEVAFMAFTQICVRPFRVPVMGFDYVATDEVLRTMGLGDAYDSYLNKALPVSNNTVEEAMTRELNDDIRDMNTIINACLDKDIRHYYTVIREASPLVALENILGSRQSVASIGFNSRKRNFPHKHPVDKCAEGALAESYNDPKTEVEIRFQIDKIISSLRYAETEAEREVVLFKIKQMTLKLAKAEQKLSSRGNIDANTAERIAVLKNFLAELEALRQKTVEKEIKTKRWSVYVKDVMPEGYDF
ncbi:MAG: hypothetical protein NC311_06755 [Muribaculaceae bacterium]|nr:hypothetical protein [Muribaculaceae bacterium]